MENEIPRLSPVWEHSLINLLGHAHTTEPTMALRQWVHFQGVHNLFNLLSWDPEELTTVPTKQVYSQDDQRQYIHVRTNQVEQTGGLITYNSGIELPEDPFHLFSPDEWAQHTPIQMRTYSIQNLPNPHNPEPVPSGPISSTRPAGYSTAAVKPMGFKKGIKREIAAYPSLKDERYFDGFKKSLFIVAKSHKM